MPKKEISFLVFIKELFHICWNAPRHVKRGLLLCCLFTGISSLFSALIPVLMGQTLNTLQNAIPKHILTGIVVFWTILYVFSGKIGQLFDDITNKFSVCVYQRYNVLFRLEKLKSCFAMPALAASTEFKQKMVASIPKLGLLGENTIYSLIWNIFHQLKFLCSYITLFVLTPLYSLLILCISILQGWFTIWINTRLKEKSEELTQQETQNNTYQQDALENIENIQMLGIEHQILDELTQAQVGYFDKLKHYQIKEIWMGLIPHTLSFINQCLFVYLALKVAFTQNNIGLYIMLSGLATDVLREVDAVLGRYKWLHQFSIQYMTLNKELTVNMNLTPRSGKKVLKSNGDIILKNVSFTYPNERNAILNNLSLKIKRGTRIAIIGDSGMGKSTLINVIRHAYEIQKGSVYIGSDNIRTFSNKSLHQMITFIHQHPTFWNQKNIRENLLMFYRAATDKDLYQALESANLLNEIMKKNQKLQARISALSAGQKQRLALARAFLRKTPLIIMDEPTANLDTHAQQKVLLALQNLSKIKGHHPTVIFASNVPAEIASAQRILLLENGKIIEDGDPKKLMANPNTKVYNRLKKYQSLFLPET